MGNGMTISQKILADHSGKRSVQPGDFVNARVDLVMANDGSGPIAIRGFEELGVPSLFDPQKVVFVLDHTIPNKDILSATHNKMVRDFARKHGTLFFDESNGGIEHAVIPEHGLVVPGDLFVGGDSHTTTEGALAAFTCGMGSTDVAVAMATGEVWMKVPHTIRFKYHGQMGRWAGAKDLILHTIGRLGLDGARYCSMQFEGETISGMSMEERFTICNMAAEAGAKNALVPFDAVTGEYVKQRTDRKWKAYEADPDCEYLDTWNMNVEGLDAQIASPFSPNLVSPVTDLAARDIPIHQVFIGSCTNGRISDLRQAAGILAGRHVASGVRCIVIPASRAIYRQCLKEGLIEVFMESGCVVSTPTCGPCLGGYMGILARGERCVSTSNRNFRGRMGHLESEVFLANPAVAATCAVKGRIAHPEEL